MSAPELLPLAEVLRGVLTDELKQQATAMRLDLDAMPLPQRHELYEDLSRASSGDFLDLAVSLFIDETGARERIQAAVHKIVRETLSAFILKSTAA